MSKVNGSSAFYLRESYRLEGTTNVICIDKPAAECSAEVVGIQVEECWGQNRSLSKTIHQPASGADIVTHVDPELAIS